MISSAMEPRLDWNRQGPSVPLWFRRSLTRLDPLLTLQFIPPRSEKEPNGVDLTMCPTGCWNICRRLPRSRLLHPLAVWSLTDIHGRFAPPGPDTMHLLRLAYVYHRAGRTFQLEEELDSALQKWNMEHRTDPSQKKYRERTAKLASIACGRQWNNRVHLKRGGPFDCLSSPSSNASSTT